MHFLILIFSLMFSAFAFGEMDLEGRWRITHGRMLQHCVMPADLEDSQKGIFVIERAGRLRQRPGGKYFGSSGGRVAFISAPSHPSESQCSLLGKGTFRGICAVCNFKVKSPERDTSVSCSGDENEEAYVLDFYTKGNLMYIISDEGKADVCPVDSGGQPGWILKKRK